MNEFNLLRQRDREMRVVTRPMTVTEITVIVREAGFRNTMTGRRFAGTWRRSYARVSFGETGRRGRRADCDDPKLCVHRIGRKK